MRNRTGLMPRADESVADLSGADLAVADPEQAWREALRAGLVGLSRDPLNCETPPELLGAGVTPTSRFFRRNHFPIPELDAAAWRLQIDGLVRHRLNLQLAELKEFGAVSQLAVLECAGNGRNLFSPLALGEQWGLGAVGNARWTGVRLADVLGHAGLPRGGVGGCVPGCRPRVHGRLAGGDRVRAEPDCRRCQILRCAACLRHER